MSGFPALHRLLVALAHLEPADAALPFDLLLRTCRVHLQAPLRTLEHLGAEQSGRWQHVRESQQVGVRARDMLNLLYPRLGDGQIFGQQLELDVIYSELAGFNWDKTPYLRLVMPYTHETPAELTTAAQRDLLGTVLAYGWDGLDVVGMLFLIGANPQFLRWYGQLLEGALNTDPEVQLQLLELAEMSVETARTMTAERAHELAEARAHLTPGNVLIDKDEYLQLLLERHP